MESTKRTHIPERREPGEEEPLRCSPGSIEQQLDMCEEGDLRGDDIVHNHGRDLPGDPPTEQPEELESNYHFDMSETDREGDEQSGDDHSSGLQGEEPEIRRQPHIDSGVPGDESAPKDTRERVRRVAS